MKSLQQYDKNLMSLGFYPSQIKNKELKIIDLKNDRELRFKLDDYHFNTIQAKKFQGNTPDKVKEVVNKNNSWFDDFEIASPAKDESKKKLADPFLFGIKDGLRYFICAWDTDIWDK